MGGGIFGTLHPFLEGGAVYGRKVANTGFMEALLRLDPFDEYHFFVTAPDALRTAFAARNDLPGAARGAVKIFSRQDLADALRATPYHCFHLSDPVSGQPELAALRNALAPRIFPITSVNHSISYLDYAQRFLTHIWPGVTARDAIGATSRAASRVLAGYFAQLREGYALNPAWLQPRLEIIPLGVDPEVFPEPTPEARRAARARFGLTDGEAVCLLHGRISLDDKLDAMPLLYALRRAMEADPAARPRLLMSGGARPGDHYPEALEAAARALKVPFSLLPDPGPEAVRALFAAADIFVSPSDNIQESFGLTLLEAGAAGLPAVVSDWDGYRDLVEHNVTGFLTPCLAPADTPLLDRLAHTLPDNIHQLFRAQQTAVDVPALAEALRRLISDAPLRARMGIAARRRVLENFTWEGVIRRWLDFWDALWREPLDAEEEKRIRAARHPAFLRLGELFSGHSSAGLSADADLPGDPLWLHVTARGERVRAGREFCVIWPGLDLCMDGVEFRRLLVQARHPVRADELIRRACPPGRDPEGARFALLWALKNDLLERVEEPR